MVMSERELIGRILRRTNSEVRVGIGDDCAVLRLRGTEEALVTTDYFIEGVHFRREWQPPGAAAHLCLTRGMSDIAAMGGRPVAVFLSLACPVGSSREWINGFLDGVLRACERYAAPLAGGDTCAAPAGSGIIAGIIAHITAVGAVVKGGAVLRSGARAGDGIYVTGALGAAQAELKRLLAGEKSRRSFLPEAQLGAGQRLRGVASAMIDSSDGLSVDLAHICEESGVSAVVELERIPIASSATLEDALHGGEDYQLIFTARPKQRVPGRIGTARIRRIGAIVKRRKAAVMVRDEGGVLSALPKLGWEHEM